MQTTVLTKIDEIVNSYLSFLLPLKLSERTAAGLVFILSICSNMAGVGFSSDSELSFASCLARAASNSASARISGLGSESSGSGSGFSFCWQRSPKRFGEIFIFRFFGEVFGSVGFRVELARTGVFSNLRQRMTSSSSVEVA